MFQDIIMPNRNLTRYGPTDPPHKNIKLIKASITTHCLFTACIFSTLNIIFIIGITGLPGKHCPTWYYRIRWTWSKFTCVYLVNVSFSRADCSLHLSVQFSRDIFLRYFASHSRQSLFSRTQGSKVVINCTRSSHGF